MWTKKEIEYFRKNAGKLSAETIAKHLKKSVPSVRQRAKREKISLKQGEQYKKCVGVKFPDLMPKIWRLALGISI